MIRLPDHLADLLTSNRALESCVYTALENFGYWLGASGKRPTFFPDYTDHSLQHVEEVLQTAVSLLREEAWEAFTASDAAVLVLSTLLHDSAMHLTREGFEVLIRPDTGWRGIGDFNDKPWSQLWTEFAAEVRRFDQRTLEDLFGDAEPVHISLDASELDEKSRRVIGEFIRRHHARLAHEIARYGVPGPTDEPLRINGDHEIVDLAGLIARSHGLPARACLPYLKDHFGSRTDPLGVHAVFLIVLLRIADFLQIQASRAPVGTLKVHKIRSPYSATEWKVHAAVRDIREHEEDPEAVYVRTKPDEVLTYLRLKGWLRDLQVEVDASWAVLGEVYSRQSRRMGKLGIRIRRIYSNLDDEAQFAKSVNYLPRRVAFTTAGADVLKLLVRPLYGDRPQFGIRELLANSVDAVLELEDLHTRGLVSAPLDRPDQQVDVQIELDRDESGEWWLTISDRGIGMTPQIVCDYFLRAGASFRNSDSWKQSFVNSLNHSRVNRSGRFGIGALAAFLLGSEINVTTRHTTASRNEGLTFTAGLDTHVVEVYYVSRPVGTTIQIKLYPHAAKTLLKALDRPLQEQLGLDPKDQFDVWDWYCLTRPSVARIIKPLNHRLPQKYTNPLPNSPLPPEWGRLVLPGYRDIQWTYSAAPGLACNGIRIRPTAAWAFTSLPRPEGLLGSREMPRLSVFDPDALLPINLQRDELTASICPFEEELLHAMLAHYVQRAVLYCPDAPPHLKPDAFWYEEAPIAEEKPFKLWGCAREGVFPCQAYQLWNMKLDSVLLVPMEDSKQATGSIQWEYSDTKPMLFVENMTVGDGRDPNRRFLTNNLFKSIYEDRHALICYSFLSTIFEINPIFRAGMTWKASLAPLTPGYNVIGAKLVIPTQVFRALNLIGAGFQVSDSTKRTTTLLYGDYKLGNHELAVERAARKAEPGEAPLLHLRVRRRRTAPEISAFSRFWHEHVQTPFIPWDVQSRLALFAGAINEFERCAGTGLTASISGAFSARNDSV